MQFATDLKAHKESDNMSKDFFLRLADELKGPDELHAVSQYK